MHGVGSHFPKLGYPSIHHGHHVIKREYGLAYITKAQATLLPTSSCTPSLAKSMHVSVPAPWSNEISRASIYGSRVHVYASLREGGQVRPPESRYMRTSPHSSTHQYSARGGRMGQPGLANEKIEKWGVRRWILRQAWDVGVKKGDRKHEALPPSLNGVHHLTSLRRAGHGKNHAPFLNICVN